MQNKFFKFGNREDQLTLDVMASEVKEDNLFLKKGDIILKSTMRGEDNGTYYELDETIEIADFPKTLELNPKNVLDWVVPHFADQYERVADHRDAFFPLSSEHLMLLAPKKPKKTTKTPKESEGGKTFRITYRNEVYVKAESEKDARAAFENMDRSTLDSESEFVEIVSVEPQD